MLREAHLRGHLDLRQARPLDRQWWRGAAWTLDWLEDQLAGEVWKLKYQLHVALLNYQLDPQTFELHWKHAEEAQGHLRHLLLPWLGEVKLDTSAVKKLTEHWQEVWGDPNDSSVAKRIQETAEALRQRNQAVAK